MPSFDAMGMGALAVDRVYAVPRIITDGAVFVEEAAVDAGGASANTIYGMAKLGLRCGFAGAVGDDADAEIILRSFADVGVDTSRIVRKEGASTSFVLALADRQADRAMYVRPGADLLFAAEDVDAPYLAQARLLLLSSLGGDIPTALQESALEPLPSGTTVALSLDALYAQRGFKAARGLLSRCAIIFANAAELCQLTGLELPAATEALLDLGLHTVVVTFGGGMDRQPWMATAAPIGEGHEEEPIACWLLTREGQTEAPSGWVLAAVRTYQGPVVDATGAGDAFAAGFLWGLLSGEPLPRCASLGHVMAGFCLARLGCRAGLPTRDELLARHDRYFD
jgi:ribokinase